MSQKLPPVESAIELERNYFLKGVFNSITNLNSGGSLKPQGSTCIIEVMPTKTTDLCLQPIQEQKMFIRIGPERIKEPTDMPSPPRRRLKSRLAKYALARLQKGNRYYRYLADSKYATLVKAHPFYILLFGTALKVLSFMIPCPWKDNNLQRPSRTSSSLAQATKWIFFVFHVLLIMMQSLRDTKYFLLGFFESRAPMAAFYLMSPISQGVIQMYVVYLLSSSGNPFSEIEKRWCSFEAMRKQENPKSNNGQTKYNILLVLIGATTLVYGIMGTMLYSWLQGLTLKEIIVDNGLELYKDIVFWSFEISHSNYTGKNLAEKVTAREMAYFCIPNYWMTAFGDVMTKFIELIVIAITMAVSSQVLYLNSVVSKRLGCDDIPGTASEEIACWQLYRFVKDINQETNEKCNCLLILFHGYTFLSFSDLIQKCLDPKSTFTNILVTFLDLVQRLYTYLLARNAATTNEKLKKWMRGLPTHTHKFEVDGRAHYTRSIMAAELTDEPLGVGTGGFFVNDRFLYQFIAGAASMILLIVTYHDKDQN